MSVFLTVPSLSISVYLSVCPFACLSACVCLFTCVCVSLCVARGTVCNVVVSQQEARVSLSAGRTPVIFNPDFFVEKLRHEKPDVFLELVLSNVTRLIDLPGAEFSLLLGGEGPKTPTSAGTGSAGGFFRSFNFLKRKGEGEMEGVLKPQPGVDPRCVTPGV